MWDEGKIMCAGPDLQRGVSGLGDDVPETLVDLVDATRSSWRKKEVSNIQSHRRQFVGGRKIVQRPLDRIKRKLFSGRYRTA